MKIGVITQRRDNVAGYAERREGIDVRWHELFAALDAALVPVPSVPDTLPSVLARISPEFLVLSGGNTPSVYGGDAPERDTADNLVIDYAVATGVPLLGVCRGAQSIALHFGGTLAAAEGHVKTEHRLTGKINRTVNSYHNFAVAALGDSMEVLARSAFDDSIEAFHYKNKKIYGVMWHPERKAVFEQDDLKMIREWLEL